MKHAVVILLVALSIVGFSSADLMVYTPEAAGQATGAFFPLERAFDAPPSTIPTVNGSAISG